MDMADCHKYPSVFVVDGCTGFPPPLPPKPGQTRTRNQRTRLIQNILLVLVCLALFGLFVEGIFIYSLHNKANHNDTTPSVSENFSVLSIVTSSVLTFSCLTFMKSSLLNLHLQQHLNIISSLCFAAQLSIFHIYGVVLNCKALSLLHTGLKHITHDTCIK